MRTLSSLIILLLTGYSSAFSNDQSTQPKSQESPIVKVESESGDPRPAPSNARVTTVRRVSSAPKAANSVEEEYPMEPYAFGFNVKDDLGNNQYRREEADSDGTIKGSYGYTDANGLYRVVEYIADKLGFRTKIRSNEPGLKSMNSPFLIMDAQEPPEAVVAAASAPREAVSKPVESLRSGPKVDAVNHPRFRYITASNGLIRSVTETEKPTSVTENSNRS